MLNIDCAPGLPMAIELVNAGAPASGFVASQKPKFSHDDDDNTTFKYEIQMASGSVVMLAR